MNGDGTVKIVVTNANLEPASPILIQKVKDYIDPEPGQERTGANRSRSHSGKRGLEGS